MLRLPYKKMFRYGIGGALGAGVDLLFLYIFTEYLGIYYLVSQVLSFVISFFVGFYFQKYVTFQQTGGSILRQGKLFLLFQLIGIGINVLLLWLLVEYTGVHYLVGSVLAKGIVFLRNFGMNHRYNFK